MDLLISGGQVVTGDGTTDRKGNVWIDGGRIVAVDFDPPPAEADVATRIDASGLVVAPGAINNHAHGCSTGPLFSSGAPALSEEKAKYNVDRYLMQGHTTILNLCGLASNEEVAAAAEGSPARVVASTVHFENSITAADTVDGVGLDDAHRRLTAAEMIAGGAVAIGEVGGGHTLGGGGQDYQYIPAKIAEELGIEVDATVARQLKMSVLGLELFGDDQGAGTLDEVLAKNGLGSVDAEAVARIVSDAVLPPIRFALAGFREAAAAAAVTGLPAVFHNSSVCRKELVELSRKYEGIATLVAGHSNHSTFTVEEAVSTAKELRDAGAVIDISSLDCVITQWRNDTTRIDALAEEKLIETLSTDYGNGHWDSMFELVHYLIRRGYYSRAEAIALATGNVARHFPLLAGGRGTLEAGKVADVAIVDEHNVGRVHSLVIGGSIAMSKGRMTR